MDSAHAEQLASMDGLYSEQSDQDGDSRTARNWKNCSTQHTAILTAYESLNQDIVDSVTAARTTVRTAPTLTPEEQAQRDWFAQREREQQQPQQPTQPQSPGPGGQTVTPWPEGQVGPSSVTIESGAITINGVTQPQETARAVEDALMTILSNLR